MSLKISGAPCCWGVDDPKNPYLPDWKVVLKEAGMAGFQGIELGPYGYIPLELETVRAELAKNDLSIIAGTIFDDLVAEENLPNLLKQVDDICSFVTRLRQENCNEEAPSLYLVVIDWGHDERDYAAGHPDRAPRLSEEDWQKMMTHIEEISGRANRYGVRAVVHPHAGGYIEFADEITKLVQNISHEVAGICLDTGHLAYSKMDPIEWIKKLYDRIDYLHFKDIDLAVYEEVMNEKIRFFDACKKQVMCPIGQGIIDYPKIYELLTTEYPYNGFITIEQERDPRMATGSLDDVKKSVMYLESVGFNQ